MRTLAKMHGDSLRPFRQCLQDGWGQEHNPLQEVLLADSPNGWWVLRRPLVSGFRGVERSQLAIAFVLLPEQGRDAGVRVRLLLGLAGLRARVQQECVRDAPAMRLAY